MPTCRCWPYPLGIFLFLSCFLCRRSQSSVDPVDLKTGRPVLEDQGGEVSDQLIPANAFKNKVGAGIEAALQAPVGSVSPAALGGETDTDHFLCWSVSVAPQATHLSGAGMVPLARCRFPDTGSAPATNFHNVWALGVT